MARSTRESILTAAAELMRHKGYGAVGMKDIAQASGAPIGSLYHHFRGGKVQIAREALINAGRAWAVHRDWWPFPGHLLDFTEAVDLAIGLVFVVLWPFWLLGKLLGVRWAVVVEREDQEVSRELVRGWAAAKARVNEIALQIA